MQRALGVLSVIVTTWIACGCGSPAAGCVPGQQIECACPGGAVSAQRCADDGQRFMDCICGPDAGAVDAGVPACPPGEIYCDTECVRANVPSNGCGWGCGSPCALVRDGTPVCSEEGRCEYVCPEGRFLDNGFCACTTCDLLGWACGEPDDGCGNTLFCGDCDGTCLDGVCQTP